MPAEQIRYQTVKSYRQINTSNEVLEPYRGFIAPADCYAGNREYLDWLHHDSHDKAFGEARRNGYRTPSRNSRVTEYFYADKLFTTMIDRARTDNAAHLAECLERIKQKVTVSIHSSRPDADGESEDSTHTPPKIPDRPRAAPPE